MATTVKTQFTRDVLADEKTDQVATLLQHNLTNLIDLALLMKQAHWCVVGPNFRSIHLQLDEIIASVRAASDEVAERISTLGIAPDGRSAKVASDSDLQQYPEGFVKVGPTIGRVADAMKTTVDELRSAIGTLGDLDPISEDMCIAITGPLEKHLWMLQAQEA
ncbi:MAG: DNA starvation/stationary phase protection protein [Rubripirellula sp.]